MLGKSKEQFVLDQNGGVLGTRSGTRNVSLGISGFEETRQPERNFSPTRREMSMACLIKGLSMASSRFRPLPQELLLKAVDRLKSTGC